MAQASEPNLARRAFARHLGAAGVFLGLSATRVAAAEGPHEHCQEHTTCLDNCRRCEQVCRETVQHCLSMAAEAGKADHVRLLLDCAEVCHTSAALMMSHSEFSARMCGICGDVCSKCADACAKVPNNEAMKACSDACRKCAQSCKEMAKAGK